MPSPPSGSPSCVEIRPFHFEKTPDGFELFDAHFLGSGFSRKVFILTNEKPIRSSAHRHKNPHLVTLLWGERMRLAYQDGEGRSVVLTLEPGRYYYIPPDVPHQFSVEGMTIAEEFSPVRSSQSFAAAGTVQTLNIDLFDTADSENKELNPVVA